MEKFHDDVIVPYQNHNKPNKNLVNGLSGVMNCASAYVETFTACDTPLFDKYILDGVGLYTTSIIPSTDEMKERFCIPTVFTSSKQRELYPAEKCFRNAVSDILCLGSVSCHLGGFLNEKDEEYGRVSNLDYNIYVVNPVLPGVYPVMKCFSVYAHPSTDTDGLSSFCESKVVDCSSSIGLCTFKDNPVEREVLTVSSSMAFKTAPSLCSYFPVFAKCSGMVKTPVWHACLRKNGVIILPRITSSASFSTSPAVNFKIVKKPKNNLEPTKAAQIKLLSKLRALEMQKEFTNSTVAEEMIAGDCWSLFWGARIKNQNVLSNLHASQRINHIPGSWALGRKDNLAIHLRRAQQKHGIKMFGFAPFTYLLPHDLPILKRDINCTSSMYSSSETSPIFILKPPASACGRGIQLFSGRIPDEVLKMCGMWDATPKSTLVMKKGGFDVLSHADNGQRKFLTSSSDSEVEITAADECPVVQRYITNPLLVNGYKVDLRVYVLVTSFDPLQVYIYNNGLVRFATYPYKNAEISTKTQKDTHSSRSSSSSIAKLDLSNVYRHLTNYSINKKSANYKKGCCSGDDGSPESSKWSIHALKHYFSMKKQEEENNEQCCSLNNNKIKSQNGNKKWDFNQCWKNITEVCIKALLACEDTIVSSVLSSGVKYRYSCFELYGFDVMLDENLSAHLIEVNVMPSLAASSPIDKHIKGTMVADLITLVGVTVNERKTKFCDVNSVSVKGCGDAVIPKTDDLGTNSIYSYNNMLFEDHRRKRDICPVETKLPIINKTVKEVKRNTNSIRYRSNSLSNISEEKFSVSVGALPCTSSNFQNHSIVNSPVLSVDHHTHNDVSDMNPEKYVDEEKSLCSRCIPSSRFWLQKKKYTKRGNTTILLSGISPQDIRAIRLYEEQLRRRGGFEQVFPTHTSLSIYGDILFPALDNAADFTTGVSPFQTYMIGSRKYLNLLLISWEMIKDRCRKYDLVSEPTCTSEGKEKTTEGRCDIRNNTSTATKQLFEWLKGYDEVSPSSPHNGRRIIEHTHSFPSMAVFGIPVLKAHNFSRQSQALGLNVPVAATVNKCPFLHAPEQRKDCPARSYFSDDKEKNTAIRKPLKKCLPHLLHLTVFEFPQMENLRSLTPQLPHNS